MFGNTPAPFNENARIGEDECGLSQRNIQNVRSGNYMLTNFKADECTLKKPMELATSMPSMMINGGHHIAPGGCNIEANNEIMLSAQFPPKPKCRISLFQRPFATVPFLGRGESNPILESYIQQGDMISNKKSMNTISEKPFLHNSNYPLIPEMSDYMNNAANFVEEEADNGWIRGGMASREMARDKDYQQKHQ